ncbi:transporter [Sphingobium sp. AN558]|uniref:transporter n=1 Tax=Sphingobium sp. AN558 TaxID=3133442 RepID=UPI0030BDBF1C
MVRHLLYFGIVAAAFAALPAAAQAQDARELCADRPGLGTPACTVEPGRLVFELGLGDWTRQKDAASETNMAKTGDALFRVGLTDSLEAQLGWTAYGHVRIRDRSTNAEEKDGGVGDIALALRQNLHNPDGSGFSVAVMPYVTLPAGGAAIGAGDWGAGLLVPVSFDLGHGLSLALTPEVDAAVDGDRSGRHLAYGSVFGLGLDFGNDVSATIETSAMRDDDPDGHSTEALAGLSFAWQPSKDMQFDIGANIGLNAASPDREIYLGVVRRF